MDPTVATKAAAARVAESLLEGLNPAQREAVVAPDRPVLVLAGAGSGKTRVLTRRVAYLIASGRADADRVLAITFTNKAAKVMRERVESLMGGDGRGMWMGTFHATSARLLRERGPLIGVPRDFVIYDEVDRKALLREAMKSLSIDEKRLSAAAAAAEISRAKNAMIGPERFAAEASGYVQTQVALIYPRYEFRLHEARALDFDDLLLRAVDLLQESPEAREHYQGRFDHVLVDEYQDTNRAQYLMLRALAEKHRHLTVVGDPDQSIYGFRGADVRNILDFQKDYPDAITVPLEQNYRSTKAILAGAQAVIRENTERLEKGLWSSGEQGARITVSRFRDERDEASAIAGEINRLVADQDTGLNDIAVLYRTNAQSRALEEVLMRTQIPYRLVGGVRFYQRKEVKDVLAYLRLLMMPEDRVSFERVVNTPRRGIGLRSVHQVLEAADRTGRSPWEVIANPRSAGIGGQAATGLLYFRQVMEGLSEWAPGEALCSVLDRLVERTGYEKYLRDGTPEGEERWGNVTELRGLASESGETPCAEALPAFLEQVALAGEVDGIDDSVKAVTLITLHMVKGMEFPAVFLTGVEDGLLPHSRSTDSLSGIEEERRLFYVGMTRAMRRLYLSHCLRRHVYGASAAAAPSRFLSALGVDTNVPGLDIDGIASEEEWPGF